MDVGGNWTEQRSTETGGTAAETGRFNKAGLERVRYIQILMTCTGMKVAQAT